MSDLREGGEDARRFSSALTFLCFCFFALAEFLIFDVFTSRHHTWIYPRWNDQIQYLTEVYTGYESSRMHGILAGLWYAITKPSAQGMLDCPLALCIFDVLGPSRSAALSLNILFVIAFQAAVFSTVLSFFKSLKLAWLSVAITLCWETLYSGRPGSGTDFRLDLMGTCAFGISLACLLYSRGLSSKKSAALFGLSVGFTILVRFLTGTYFAFIFASLLVFFLVDSQRWKRVIHLIIAAFVAAAIAGPIFWLNRGWIWDYYYIGHYFGPESAIRDPHMNIQQSVHFLLDRLYEEHLGKAFVVIGCATTLVAIASLGIFWRKRDLGEWPRLLRRHWFIPSLIYLICPFVLLTLHNQKSPVVVSIFVPSIVFLTVGLLAVSWSEKVSMVPNPYESVFRRVFFAIACVLSAANFVNREIHSRVDPAFERDARKVNALADKIYSAAQSAKLANPRVGVDQVTDCLDGQVLRVICYERHKTWIPFVMTLPTGIATENAAILMERVQNSDFLFIAVNDGGPPTFPYDAEMRSLRAKHLAWCRANLKLVEQFDLFGRTWDLYEQPTVANSSS